MRPGYVLNGNRRTLTRMAKARSRNSGGNLRSVPVMQQPTVLYPVVWRVRKLPPGHKLLSDTNFRALEQAGGIKLQEEAREALENTAAGWISHDLMLQSPRPRQFQQRLKEMEGDLERLIVNLDLNRGDAPLLDHHLYNWLINNDFFGVDALSANLIHNSKQLINLLRHVQKSLPADKGRRRPMDDDRFVIYLAEQFEKSGGRSRAYRSAHTESGYGGTHFRKFVHRFYELLPLKSRRTESGLDETIIRALEYRRHSQKG
jgi:hypothetical protein